jgi:uncharacterized membrane protein HdeD (DUF308 family)
MFLMEESKKKAFNTGILVLVALAILTGIEFFIAISLPNAIILLFIAALLKAAPIMQVFMHMSSLWSEEEGH